MPPYTVSVKKANRPKGDPIEVPSVGVVENGSSKTVELDADTAKSLNGSGVSVKKATKNDEGGDN